MVSNNATPSQAQSERNSEDAPATSGSEALPTTAETGSQDASSQDAAGAADPAGAASSDVGAGSEPAADGGDVSASDSSAGEAGATEASAAETSPAAETADAGAGEADTAQASPAEAGEAEAGAAEAGAGEAGTAEAATAESAEADGAGDKKKKKRRRRKKKKSGEDDKAEKADAASPKAARASDRAPFHTGEEVFGRVTAVLETAIMIDLSGKALAIFDRTEMEPDDLVPEVGDRFVARVHHDGSRGGLVVLTRKPLREEEAKPRVEQAAKDGSLVQALVTGVIKGGVEVDIGGLRAFAPASGMDLHPAHANFTSLLGQRMDFKVLQFEKGGRDIVVTRRPMLEAEAHERRKQALTHLQEGMEMQGVVRTVVEWGAFVALPEAENLEGLVHVTEASHDPRAKITDVVKAGDKVKVKIIKIDDKGKIWLSRKALLEDPWGRIKATYAQGSQHKGKVTRLEKFGAFVELEADIDGLLHIADLSLNRIEHPSELLQPGQELDVIVHHFDYKSRKIALHPAPPPERANEPKQRVAKNAIVKAEVVKAESAGVVVRVLGVTGRSARGFVPAGQTGTARGTDLRKTFKPGSVLDLKVIDVDPRRGEPKLSVRQFKEDEERRAHREYRQKLKAEGNFGTLGDLLKQRLNLQQNEDSSK